MRHEIAHMGIVNGRLRTRLPCLVGRLIVGIEADDIDRIEIAKFGAVEIDEFAAEDEMKKLLA